MNPALSAGDSPRLVAQARFCAAVLRGFWARFLVVAALDFASRAPLYLLPWVWKSLVDNLAGEKSLERLVVSGSAFAGVLAIQAIFAQLRGLWACRFGERVSERLRLALWRKSAIDWKPSSGAINADAESARLRGLLASDLAQLEGFFGHTLPSLLASGAVLATLAALTGWLSPRTLFAIVALSPLLLICFLAFRGRMRRDALALQEAQEAIQGTLHESVSALPLVRAGQAGAWWGDAILNAAFRGRRARAWRQARSLALSSGAMTLGFAVFGTAVTVFSGYEVWRGALTLGAWVAICDMWLGMVGEGKRALGEARASISALAAAERVADFLEGEDSLAPSSEPPREACSALPSLGQGGASLEMRDVWFFRGERAILRGASLTVEPGCLLVVSGPSGVGKTTLCHLAAGLLAPDRGEVLLGGRRREDWPSEDWRQRVAIIFQDPIFFAGTLRENLLLGRGSIEDRRVWEVLESVNARGIAERLPGGLEGRVAEGGASLSLGERRRLGLARALLRDPELLIADEPLSALDAENVALCLETLRTFSRTRGLLLVSHLPQALAAADLTLSLGEEERV
jgi:ABC-type multidrug transport system fused ATPase/permease subunit